MAKKAKKGNGKAKVAAKPEQPKEATKAKSGDTRQGQGDKTASPPISRPYASPCSLPGQSSRQLRLRQR